jgi:hypothetical protein
MGIGRNMFGEKYVQLDDEWRVNHQVVLYSTPTFRAGPVWECRYCKIEGQNHFILHHESKVYINISRERAAWCEPFYWHAR